LGLTKGQECHVPTRECTRRIKKVFAYELTNDWRMHLGVAYVDLHPHLEVGFGLDIDLWAEQEFGKIDLGHAVRNARLVGKTTGGPVTTTMERDPAGVQAFWRFWGKADQFGVTVEKILLPHRIRTIERSRTQDAVICVMDREADAFEILALQRTLKRTHLLVRAKHNRKLGTDRQQRLFKAMRKGPAAGVLELSIARLSRREKSERVTSHGREPCHARMEIRYGKYRLPPTKDATQEPMPVWGIHMHELSPPANTKPLEWYLLTTQEITSLEQSKDRMDSYKLRWQIEDNFRVLKTGCKVEKVRMQDAESLHRVITLYMVSAWRIMLMTLLGRETANLARCVFYRIGIKDDGGLCTHL